MWNDILCGHRTPKKNIESGASNDHKGQYVLSTVKNGEGWLYCGSTLMSMVPKQDQTTLKQDYG